jgi:hypothetical protein
LYSPFPIARIVAAEKFGLTRRSNLPDVGLLPGSGTRVTGSASTTSLVPEISLSRLLTVTRAAVRSIVRSREKRPINSTPAFSGPRPIPCALPLNLLTGWPAGVVGATTVARAPAHPGPNPGGADEAKLKVKGEFCALR